MVFMNVSNVFHWSMQAVAQRMILGERKIDLPEPDRPDLPKPDLMNRLPNELLDEIFQCIMVPPEDSERTRINRVSRSDHLRSAISNPMNPFTLTQVCRRWRHVAQGAPQLWSSIAILHPSKLLLYPVELWMRFANRLPLKIFFLHPESVDDLEAASDIINLLGTRYKQWCDVRFVIHKERLPPALAAKFKLISDDLSSILQAATIANECGYTSSAEDVATTWRALNRTPSLKRLVWLPRNVPFRLNLAAHQLQSLVIREIACRDLVESLNACGSLQELDAELVGNSMGEGPSGKVVEHHLQDIKLRGGSTDIEAVLARITLPRVVSVDIYSINPSGLNALRSLVDRSNASLTKLRLRIHEFSCEAMAACIQWPSFASLETFEVSGAPINDDVIHNLTVYPLIQQRPFYLQRLQNLTMSVCIPQMDENLFIRMLGSRLFTTPDQPYKVDLMVAAFVVAKKTVQIRMYEDLCHQMIAATPKENVIGLPPATVPRRQTAPVIRQRQPSRQIFVSKYGGTYVALST